MICGMAQTQESSARVLRILILTEAALLVMSLVAHFLLVRFLPDALRAYEEQTWESELATADLVLTPLIAAAFLLHVAGWILIWKRSTIARLIYTTSWAALSLIAPLLGSVVSTGIGSAIDTAATLTGGMILGVLYFGEKSARLSD